MAALHQKELYKTYLYLFMSSYYLWESLASMLWYCSVATFAATNQSKSLLYDFYYLWLNKDDAHPTFYYNESWEYINVTQQENKYWRMQVY